MFDSSYDKHSERDKTQDYVALSSQKRNGVGVWSGGLGVSDADKYVFVNS